MPRRIPALSGRASAHRATDHGDLDAAATIATYAGLFGYLTENYEPITWVEELIEPARAVEHPRLAFLYVIASLCYLAGRIEAAVGYCDAGQSAMRDGRGDVPFGLEAFFGGAYLAIGQPIRWAEWCRTRLAWVRDTHAFIRSTLVLMLNIVGSCDEAIAAAPDAIDAERLVAELETVFAAAGGPPKVLRMDNGPELVSQALQRFCDGKVDLSYIPPGQPWDNGYIESFNNRLRKECLNRNHWNTLFEARVVIGDFKHEHNHRHRHSALGYRTPAEYAAACRHTHTPVACEIN